MVAIAGEVVLGRLGRAGADPADIPGRLDPLGLAKILHTVVAGLVDIGIDAVGSQIPGPRRHPHADVAAHLADPHRPAVEGHLRQPQSEMEALVDRVPGSLQGDVLAAGEEMERADRRVAVVDTEKEGLHRLPAGGQRDRLAVVPASGEGGQEGVEGADDDEVDRIAPLRADGIGRRRRQSLEPADELGRGTGNDARRRHELVEVEVEVIGSNPRDGDGEVEVDDEGARR